MLNGYPIFENGQVLTSKHLNDLAGFLAQQDQLTRRKLIGIGIVCGLEVDYPSDDNLLRIGAGVAVTSAGHLIAQDECRLDRYRDYTLPSPMFEEIPEELALPEEPPYPFFMDDAGKQMPLWELFAREYVPTPGESDLTPIDGQFLRDKVVLLFLECLESGLKSCELHDCSDKGAQLTFTVRKLLVRQSDAQAMLDRERSIAERPVDLSRHPKYTLQPLRHARINPAGNDLATFEDLFHRVLEIHQTAGPEVVKALQAGYEAYAYLLADIYPARHYPAGPFADTEMMLKGLDTLGQNIFLMQYIHDLLYDLIQSHNEFLAAAMRLEAECCPHPERFPKHVLLGRSADQPTAFDPPPPRSAFDPLRLDTGFGAVIPPARFRHHFIPSLAFDRQNEKLQRVRSLHYRTFLLAYRYFSDDLFKQAIRITPSRDGDVPLSDKAIPFYYAFQENDDLHRNWSFEATRRNGLAQVHAHRLTARADHPLQYHHEGHDFYRIEGIVGQKLGDTMRDLLGQKQALGLSFAIEPVYMGLSVKDDPSSIVLDKEVRGRLQQALMKLLLCRFRDLDVVFLVLMMTLFYFLYVIIARLSGLGANALALLPSTTAPTPTTPTTPTKPTTTTPTKPTTTTTTTTPPTTPTTPTKPTTTTTPTRPTTTRPTIPGTVRPRAQIATLKPGAVRVATTADKLQADTLLKEIRQTTYVKGGVTTKLRPTGETEVSVGDAYEKIGAIGTGDENLFDRTLQYAKTLDLEARPEEIAGNLYPTLSLIDKAEGLIGTVSASSIADIDLPAFQQKVTAFEVAYDEYLSHADATDSRNRPEIAGAQETLTLNRSQLEAGGSITMINSMLKEYQTRMAQIFSELVMEGYAGRHPGMEHKCGVPAGGTLILLYTHQNLIRQVLGKNQNGINAKINTAYAQFGITNPGRVILNPEIVLAAAPSTADPLNDFVVLGDFCLPYMCCDTDCSDILLAEQPSSEPPRTGIAAGRIFGTPAGADIRSSMALDKPVVAVTSVDRGEAVPVETVGEAFSFAAPAGIYRIQVKHSGYQTAERLVTINEGGQVFENFVLDRPGD